MMSRARLELFLNTPNVGVNIHQRSGSGCRLGRLPEGPLESSRSIQLWEHHGELRNAFEWLVRSDPIRDICKELSAILFGDLTGRL